MQDPLSIYIHGHIYINVRYEVCFTVKKHLSVYEADCTFWVLQHKRAVWLSGQCA